MKFATSDFWTFDKRPTPWCDYMLDEKDTIEKYLSEVVLYYTDIYDCFQIEFMFENGNAYKVEMEVDPRDCVHYSTKVDPSELENCQTKYRDWIGTSPQHASLLDYVVKSCWD